MSVSQLVGKSVLNDFHAGVMLMGVLVKKYIRFSRNQFAIYFGQNLREI